MKKGISNIIVLALVIVNLVLTVILVFTFLPSIKKTNNLVTAFCHFLFLLYFPVLTVLSPGPHDLYFIS